MAVNRLLWLVGIAALVAIETATANSALLLAPPAMAGGSLISQVGISNETNELTLALQFTRGIDDLTRLRISIDVDRDPATGVNGIDYALDWTGIRPVLLEAANGQVVESEGGVWDLEYKGDAVLFTITHPEVEYWAFFDFYVFVERSRARIKPWSQIPFSAGKKRWPYPSGHAGSAPEIYRDPAEPFPLVARSTPRQPKPPATNPAASDVSTPLLDRPLPARIVDILTGALSLLAFSLGAHFILRRAGAAREPAGSTAAAAAAPGLSRPPAYDHKVWRSWGLLTLGLAAAGVFAAAFAGGPDAPRTSDYVLAFGTGIWLFVVPGTAIYFERVNSRYRSPGLERPTANKSPGRGLAITALVLATIFLGPLALAVDYLAWRRIAATDVRFARGAAVAAVACIAGFVSTTIFAAYYAADWLPRLLGA